METLYSDNDITITETTITTTSGKTLQLKVLSDVAIGQELTSKGELGKRIHRLGFLFLGICVLCLWIGRPRLQAELGAAFDIFIWCFWGMFAVGTFLLFGSSFFEDKDHKKGDMRTLIVKIGYTEQVLLRSTDGEHIRSLMAIISQQLRKMQTETSSES